jgi:hypothetical protein
VLVWWEFTTVWRQVKPVSSNTPDSTAPAASNDLTAPSLWDCEHGSISIAVTTVEHVAQVC